MTAFIAISLALTAMIVALLVRGLRGASVVAPPSADESNAAIYRDQLAELDGALGQGSLSADRHAIAREDIRLRMAEDLRPQGPAAASPKKGRAAALVLVLALPLAAAIIYALIGNPQALSPQKNTTDESAHGLQSEQILGMVQRLSSRLAQNPEDVPGWVMLARSYSSLGRFEDASRAYAQATRRATRDAQLLADHADAVAMAQGRRFDGEPDRLVAAALAADPANIKALALAGTSSFGRKDYARAVSLWSRIRDQVPFESEMARSVEGSIAQARSLMGESGTATKSAAKPAAKAANFVGGTVKLAPAIATRVSPADTLFIYARAEGSLMPVAILKKRAADLPLAFRLDDSHAMSPSTVLSGLHDVVVSARISKSGDATARSGDFEATLGPVRVGTDRLVLEIARVVP